MKDHHVDRPGVEVGQPMKLTGSDRPIGSDLKHHAWKSSPEKLAGQSSQAPILGSGPRTGTHQNLTRRPPNHAAGERQPRSSRRVHATDGKRNPWMDWTTWWLWRGARTRSLPELGRENPQRPWYCVSRHGRVGRRQVFQSMKPNHCRGVEQPGSSSGS